MSLTENSDQVFLPGGATNSQNSPYISVWPLDQFGIEVSKGAKFRNRYNQVPHLTQNTNVK